MEISQWRQNICNYIQCLRLNIHSELRVCVLLLFEIVPHIWTNEDDMNIFVYVCELNFFKYIYVCVKIMSLSLKAFVYGRQNGNLIILLWL
jgi:hypothetical protein